MGLSRNTYNINELVRLTSSGVEVSSFVEVKNALIKRYKEIYGNDIDIETISADGQYIMMLSLLLYNGYNGLIYLNKNLSPATATGKYLDVLCGLNNVFRQSAYHSYAYLYVKYVGNKDEYYSDIIGNTSTPTQSIQCIDKSGRIWTWTEGGTTDSYKVKFKKGDSTVISLLFTCEDAGAIEAYADETVKSLNPNAISWDMLNANNHGDISETLDINMYPFEVWQANDAVTGEDDESDETLRSRLLTERGNSGITVKNGLVGSLIGINGIEEAKLYNNNSEVTGMKTNDGLSVAYHNIYIILRYKENLEMDTNLIGNTINEKLTPGIVTSKFSEENKYPGATFYDTTGENCEVSFAPSAGLAYSVYWKKCIPIYPSMKLCFKVNNTIYNQAEKEQLIIKSVKDYLFNLNIYDDINMPNILYELNSKDTQVNNQFTFMFYDGSVSQDLACKKLVNLNSGEKTFANKDTYYKYNNFTSYDTRFVETEVTSETFTTDGTLYIKDSNNNYAQVKSGSFDSKQTYYMINELITNSYYYKFTKVSSSSSSTFEDWTLDLYKLSSYTVSFDSNGGSSVLSQILNEGEKVTKPTDPTKPSDIQYHYVFDGWYKDALLQNVFNFDTDIVENNMTLYAKWNAVTEVYTVQFDTNGGSVIESEEIPYGGKAIKPEDPTKSPSGQYGYSFAGWYKDSTLLEPFDFETERIISDTTIYAKWTEVPIGPWTVTFTSTDGEVQNLPSPQIIPNGGYASEPSTEPYKPSSGDYDYNFKYWSLNRSWYEGPVFDFTNTPITSDITLYAIFEEIG